MSLVRFRVHCRLRQRFCYKITGDANSVRNLTQRCPLGVEFGNLCQHVRRDFDSGSLSFARCEVLLTLLIVIAAALFSSVRICVDPVYRCVSSLFDGPIFGLPRARYRHIAQEVEIFYAAMARCF